ncbi:hypothetical protein BH09VER1_BH09VER1_20130 [soil metagenome]
MSVFTNIAAYRFAELKELPPLRERLIAHCRGWNLKGTILLSPEGINLFVAGNREEIDLLVVELQAIPGLAELAPKYSESAAQPFKRMLVRIKKEIIAFGVEGIRPGERTSPKLGARTLKQWLDEGRPITLLDTRNDYEVKLGTFKGAKILGLDHFREFPKAVSQLPADMKEEPIVMFCTGGIRCEKAGPYMEQEGFRNIYQLDGGILKYFEECGADHYEGECFVFDQRVGVDPALQETESSQCFACQTPLTVEEQEDERFVVGVSCPHCFRSEEELMAERVHARQTALNEATSPLPGAKPYAKENPFVVPPEQDGQKLIDCLCAVFPLTSRDEWEKRCAEGCIVDLSGQRLSSKSLLRARRRYIHLVSVPAEPDVSTEITVLQEDDALVLVRKPAGLPTKPEGEFSRNNLQYILQRAYAPEKPRPVHYVECGVEGLVLCARTRHIWNLLKKAEIAVAPTKISLIHPLSREAVSFEY